MSKITAYNLVRAIGQLPRNVNYNYINPKTRGLIHIENVLLPAGPSKFADGILVKVKLALRPRLKVFLPK